MVLFFDERINQIMDWDPVESGQERFDRYFISLQVLSLEFEDDDDLLLLDETVSRLYDC